MSVIGANVRGIPVVSSHSQLKGFVLPRQTKGDDIIRLQTRFGGKLTVVKDDEGSDLVFSEDFRTSKNWVRFARFASLPEVSHLPHHNQ